MAFFVAPAAMVAAAISARGAGIVDSRAVVEARLRRFLPAARAAAASERVPLDLVLAVASVESAGRPDARSGADAVGLMQLLPSTAEEIADRPSPRLTDPATSLTLGARYLRMQLDAFAGYAAAEELALCAYNAGPGAVGRWLDEDPLPRDAERVGGWIPPRWHETRGFVRRVGEWRAHWRDALDGRSPAR